MRFTKLSVKLITNSFFSVETTIKTLEKRFKEHQIN